MMLRYLHYLQLFMCCCPILFLYFLWCLAFICINSAEHAFIIQDLIYCLKFSWAALWVNDCSSLGGLANEIKNEWRRSGSIRAPGWDFRELLSSFAALWLVKGFHVSLTNWNPILLLSAAGWWLHTKALCVGASKSLARLRSKVGYWGACLLLPPS